MIEKRYTGIAKQGADVVANPTLDGSEQALNSIRINGENFKIEGGGSGKLKLVATGQGGLNGYALDKLLESNKLYLVFIDNQTGNYTSTTIISSFIDQYECYPLVLSAVYDGVEDTLINGFMGLDTLDYVAAYDQDKNAINAQHSTIYVYELEFGGSSGGGEKDSYEFWENYANNILGYQNSNEKGKYISGSVTYDVNSHIEIENFGILNNIENSTALSIALDGFMYVDKTKDEFGYFDDYRIEGMFYIGNCTLYSEEGSVYAHCFISVTYDGKVYVEFEDGSIITLLAETLLTSGGSFYDIINNRQYEF